MILLLGFSFLAGIVTILSPCILPILPIVLTGSVGSGKRKPLGIITGFILSFTFFTLTLATIVKATGIPSDSLRIISVVIIFLFGVSLLIPYVQVFLERLFSKLSGAVSTGGKHEGFMGGVVVGLSLGLIWTPCVGPIIASVITLAATSSVNFAALFITLAYSLGTAIPMFLIMISGRKIFEKVPWLLSKAGLIQKIFGVMMILTALAIFFQVDRKFQTYVITTFPEYGIGLTKFEDNKAVRQQLEKLAGRDMPDSSGMVGQPKSTYMMAPAIIPGGEWFNLPSGKKSLSIKELKGKVVLIDFWTYTCINCIRTLPYLADWHKKYADKGLVIIGVHTPEFAFEKDAKNVQKAIEDFKIEYPVVQDNDYATWNAYSNRYWPAKYFIDKDGNIRSSHFGEGSYDESEKLIQELLKESGSDVSDITVSNKDYVIESGTPELYLGYGRIEYFSSPESILRDKNQVYTAPATLPASTFAYSGSWMIGSEYAQAGKNAALTLNYDAKNAFLVMRSVDGKPARVRVTTQKPLGIGNDVVNGVVTVTTDRLYTLIENSKREQNTIKLEFLDGNVEVFAFTFG